MPRHKSKRRKSKRKKVSWAGWAKLEPSTHQRTVMLRNCGRKCFLGPNKSFPVCTKNTCKVNKKGLKSASIRARQWGKSPSSYRGKTRPTMNRRVYKRVARKASKMLKSRSRRKSKRKSYSANKRSKRRKSKRRKSKRRKSKRRKSKRRRKSKFKWEKWQLSLNEQCKKKNCKNCRNVDNKCAWSEWLKCRYMQNKTLRDKLNKRAKKFGCYLR